MMFTNGRDEYMLPEHRQQSSPISIPVSAQTWHNLRTSTAGPSSSAADDDSETQSNSSCPSTAPSSAPSLNPPPLPPPAINPMNYESELRCEFEFVDCYLSFHPTQIERYISHTASHFLGHLPPRKTICIFCDRIFEDPNDPAANWTRRMRHIADHYRHLERYEHSRPDFLLINHMRSKRIMSSEDYKWATEHSERPYCDGLVDRSYRTPEMKRREKRLIAEPHDLEKEDRHRRRHASKAKGKDKGK
jgi:hypothetical protein